MKTLFSLIAMAAVTISAATARASSPEDKDYAGYLFTYFTGNSMDGEQIRFAVSNDGYNYKALNDNRPVIDSKAISSTGGVRDPHILRGVDGETFYMVVTDMVSGNGWDSNRAMVLLKSRDLINWDHSVVNIQKRYPGQGNLKRVWAPQTIYDNEAGKYMVYWSMKHGDGPDIIYYAYANDDFTDLEGDYKPLFLPSNGKSCIDGDIVWHDGLYHLFYKTEGHGNGIKVAVTPSLTSGEWT
ncbi:MAG: glycoside hydrolase family 43 protein, partial [Muribaculaceae bacterium]|nr:glycoside hydrolase family 43 protein [Muribaculaceae bacterium]